jgi:hypothetical protein
MHKRGYDGGLAQKKRFAPPFVVSVEMPVLSV